MRFMPRRINIFSRIKESKFTIKIYEIYDNTIRPLSEDDLISKAKSLLKSRGISQVAVIHKNHKLMGTVKRHKLLKHNTSIFSFVKDIADEANIFACINSDITDTTIKMLENKEDCIPVIKEEVNMIYEGIVGLENVMDALTKINTELLNHNVEAIMKKNKSFCYPDDTISRAWEKMNEENTTGLFVINNKRKVIGVITHHDMLQSRTPGIDVAIENHKDTNYITVSRLMNKHVIAIRPTCTIIEAAKTMLKYKIGRLPIIKPDNGEYIGSVTKEDIVKYLIPSLL